MNNVVAYTMRKAIKSQYLCEYSLISSNIRKIACDCGDIPGAGCFNGTDLIQLGEVDVFSGLGTTSKWGKITVTTFPSTVSNTSDSATILIFAITDLSFLNAVPILGKRSLFLGTGQSSVAYEVVFNVNGSIIGQIVGAGVGVQAGNITGGVQICITIDTSIPIDPWFNISDFGVPHGGNNNLTAQMLNTTIVSGQICAVVTNSTTYFPIYRNLNPLPPPVTISDDSDGDTDGTSPETSPPDDHQGGIIAVSCILAGTFVLSITAVVVSLLIQKRNESVYVKLT